MLRGAYSILYTQFNDTHLTQSFTLKLELQLPRYRPAYGFEFRGSGVTPPTPQAESDVVHVTKGCV